MVVVGLTVSVIYYWLFTRVVNERLSHESVHIDALRFA